MKSVPSEVVEIVRSLYPSFAEHTSVGGRADVGKVASIVSALEAVPDELVPPTIHTRFATVLGRFRSSLRSWEAGNVGTHYMSGRDLGELLQLLAQCPDESVPTADSRLLFIADEPLRHSIGNDVGSAHSALANGEWKAATILAGSAIEALLLAVLVQRHTTDMIVQCADALAKDKTLTKVPHHDILRWEAFELLAVSGKLGLIGSDSETVANTTRGYRNLIHPGREIRLQQRCTKGTAHVAVGAMERIIEDLGRAHP